MDKNYEKVVMKAIALCFKPYLKPEEAMIYCDLEKSRFAVRCEQFGLYKNSSGYFRKEDLDRMMSGDPPLSMNERLKALNVHREGKKKSKITF